MNNLLRSLIPNNVPDEEETKIEEPQSIYVPTLVFNITMKYIGERYKRKQEIIHLILQEPMVFSDFYYMNVHLEK